MFQCTFNGFLAAKSTFLQAFTFPSDLRCNLSLFNDKNYLAKLWEFYVLLEVKIKTSQIQLCHICDRAPEDEQVEKNGSKSDRAF